MAIAFVQDDFAQGSSSSPTVTFGSNTTTGSAIVVVVSFWNFAPAGALNCSDNKGNGNYPELVSMTFGGQLRLRAWAALNAAGGAGHQITLSDGSYHTLWVAEYSGVATASAGDGTNTADLDNVTDVDTGSVTTTQAGDLVIGAATSNSGPTTWGAGAGFTLRCDNPSTSNQNLATVEQVQVAAGAINPRITAASSLVKAFGITFALKAAGGGGGGTKAPAHTHRPWRFFRRVG